MKKLICVILAVLICTGLIACSTPDGPGGANTTAPIQGTGENTTSPPETEAPAFPVSLISEGATEYIIIRPDNKNEVITAAATNLRAKLNEVTGANIGITTDWFKKGDEPPASAREIVVGACARPATERILGELRERDFAIVYEGERIYIVGGNDEATSLAVEYFLGNYVDTPSKTLTVLSDLNYINRYDYALGMISVDGVLITQYDIVIPEGCGLYTSSAAQNLSDYLYYNGGIMLDIVSDTTPAGEYEILVGKTNRAESSAAAAVSLADDQYVLAMTGSKIVMMGDSYMIGGAVGEFINSYAVSAGKNAEINITTLPTEYTASTFRFTEARNAIILIGDGMGFNHIKATLAAGLSEFVAEQLPNRGSASTYSHSVTLGTKKYTDSAAAATALSSGYKTIDGYIGMNPALKKMPNIREIAAAKGARTSVLTTDLITGATPGGFLAHVPDRNATSAIQSQIDKLIKDKEVDFAVGSIGDNLVKEAGRQLWTISEDGSLFFSMIEEAYIDKRSHSNDMAGVISTTTRYNSLIAYVVQFVLCHPDTALIVTADHETGNIQYNPKTDKYEFNSKDHTNSDVPVFAIGPGTEYFKDKKVDNTDIAKFMAKIYGENNFGS